MKYLFHRSMIFDRWSNAMKKVFFSVVMIVCAGVFNVYAGDDAEAKFESMVHKTYDFEVSKLTDEMKEKKSAEMDEFWKFVESGAGTYLPLLRRELGKDSLNRFFYYDGSMLLGKLSQSRDDINLILRTIPKADINDVDQSQYFQFVHWAGCQGYDTYADVRLMIDCPSFSVAIPEHSLKLSQSDAVLYALLPVDEKYYLDSLITRLKSEKDPRTAMTILTVVAYTISDKGQNAIKAFADSTADKTAKECAKEYLVLESRKTLPARNVVSKHENLEKFLQMFTNREYDSREINFDEYVKDAPYLVTRGDYGMIRKYRSIQSQRVSDEAMREIEYLSMLMRYAFTSDK